MRSVCCLLKTVVTQVAFEDIRVTFDGRWYEMDERGISLCGAGFFSHSHLWSFWKNNNEWFVPTSSRSMHCKDADKMEQDIEGCMMSQVGAASSSIGLGVRRYEH